MMLETVHEVFGGIVMPAFMTIMKLHQQNIRGEINVEPRDKQCEAFHQKAREMTKGKLKTSFDMINIDTVYVTQLILP